MRLHEKYLCENKEVNKQITVSLNTEKRKVSFNLRGLFPPALIMAMEKALKKNQYTIEKDEFTIYI